MELHYTRRFFALLCLPKITSIVIRSRFLQLMFYFRIDTALFVLLLLFMPFCMTTAWTNMYNVVTREYCLAVSCFHVEVKHRSTRQAILRSGTRLGSQTKLLDADRTFGGLSRLDQDSPGSSTRLDSGMHNLPHPALGAQRAFSSDSASLSFFDLSSCHSTLQTTSGSKAEDWL